MFFLYILAGVNEHNFTAKNTQQGLILKLKDGFQCARYFQQISGQSN